MASQKRTESTATDGNDNPSTSAPSFLPGDPSTRLDAKGWRKGVWIVCILSILVFIHGLANQNVWDDHMLIGGSAIGGGDSLLFCFTKPFLDNFFRPLVSVWFFFERYVWAWHAAGYHATGILIHALGTWVVACLLRRVLPSDRAALIGAAAFAIHPVQVGSVAWTGGRTDTLVVLWSALFLLNVVKVVQEQPFAPKRVWLATLFYALAVFTKEQAVPLVLAGPLAALWLAPSHSTNETPSDAQPTVSRRLAFLLALPPMFLAIAFLYLGSNVHLPHPNFALVDPGLHGLTFLRTTAYYLLLLLTPSPQGMFALSVGSIARMGVVGLALGVFAIVLPLGLLAVWSRRAPNLAWLLAIALLALLPVSGMLPMPFLQAASYRACLATIGLSGIAGWFFTEWLPARIGDPTLRGAARFAAGTIALWWIALTVWGTTVWRTQHSFFAASAAFDPDSIVAHHLMAYQFGYEESWAKAAAEYERCLTLVYQSDQWREPASAGEQFQADSALRRRVLQNQGNDVDPPKLWLAAVFTKLGSARLWSSDQTGGAKAYEAGVAVDPTNAEALYGVGYAAYFRYDMPVAAEFLSKAVQHGSKNTDLRGYLARALGRIGRWQEAAQPAKEYLDANPSMLEAYTVLARVQIENKNYFGAITTLTGANTKFPDDPNVTNLMQEATRRATEQATPPASQ
jgi:tetratricopeptide (TPR) repeat protein